MKGLMKLKVNGENLYYEMHGEGKPLVLIAGLTCDTTFWRPIIYRLSHHFQVLIFDNRGVGQSDSPDEPYYIEDMAKDTVCLIKALELENPHILGHSMGGAIAQTIAHKHPDLIDKLIISNSLIKLNSAARLMEQSLINFYKDNVDRKKIIEAQIPWIFSSDFLQDEKTVEGLINYELTRPHPQTFIGFKRQVEALFQFDSSKWYQKIPHTTLVIGCDEDILCPHDSETLGKNIPRAHYVNFHKVGHAPSIEKPKEFNQAILEFLK
jgi:3-oxoadipate enol-lactonase